MNIANKLKVMAVGSIIALIAVGGIGIVAMNNLDGALAYSNQKAIPSIQLIYQIKTQQQLVALGVYRHIGAADKSQMTEIEGAIATAAKAMGDALTGVVAALWAQGLPAIEAARLGVLAHALAGDRAARAGERGLLASDLIAELRSVLNP